MAVVGLVRSAVVVVTRGEDENVVTTTERVLEDGSGPQVDIGVATGSLVGGRAVEVPDTQLTNIGHFLVDSLYGDSQTTRQGICESELAVVLERRPPSPSTQTSGWINQRRARGDIGTSNTYIRPGLSCPGRGRGMGPKVLGGSCRTWRLL